MRTRSERAHVPSRPGAALRARERRVTTSTPNRATGLGRSSSASGPPRAGSRRARGARRRLRRTAASTPRPDARRVHRARRHGPAGYALPHPGCPRGADGRPRLHPQRPVRPVLPRRPGRLLPRRGPRGHVREQDRPRADHARRPGRDRRRDRRRDERHPGREPGDPGPLRLHRLRRLPEHRLRQGVFGDRRTRRPDREEDRHPRQVRVVVDPAPGAARGRGPDPGGRRDRALPRLRPADRAPAGRRRRRDGVREQRARPDGAGRDARPSCWRCRPTRSSRATA